MLPLNALILALIFLVLGLLHIYWATGGDWGSALAVPEKEGKPLFKPGPVATLLVALLLILAALVALARAGLVHLSVPAILFQVGIWILFAVFLLRAIGDFQSFARTCSRFHARFHQVGLPLCLEEQTPAPSSRS